MHFVILFKHRVHYYCSEQILQLTLYIVPVYFHIIYGILIRIYPNISALRIEYSKIYLREMQSLLLRSQVLLCSNETLRAASKFLNTFSPTYTRIETRLQRNSNSVKRTGPLVSPRSGSNLSCSESIVQVTMTRRCRGRKPIRFSDR